KRSAGRWPRSGLEPRVPCASRSRLPARISSPPVSAAATFSSRRSSPQPPPAGRGLPMIRFPRAPSMSKLGAMVRRSILAALLLLVAPGVAFAGFKEAVEAYQRGDFTTAFAELQPLAEQGVLEAQYNLGILYEKGEGVDKDLAKAASWYEKAADQGDP